MAGDVGDEGEVIGSVPIRLAAALPPASWTVTAWLSDRNLWRSVGECFQSPLRDPVVVNEVGNP
jgi:hypothetical protein